MSKLSEGERAHIRESEKYKKTKKLLKPMYQHVERAKAFHTSEFDRFIEMCIGFKERWKESLKVSEILRGLKTEITYPSPQYKSMSKMLVYLGLVESLGVALADATLILFIVTGKDVHTRGPMTRHVTKAKELEKIDLSYKLDFLKNEGFDLFNELIKRDVRNTIAHLNFTIQDDGEIRNRDNSPIHIDEVISSFWESVDMLKLVFEDVGLLKWFEKEVINNE